MVKDADIKKRQRQSQDRFFSVQEDKGLDIDVEQFIDEIGSRQ